MIVQVEFDTFTRVQEHIKRQPLLLGRQVDGHSQAESSKGMSRVSLMPPRQDTVAGFPLVDLQLVS